MNEIATFFRDRENDEGETYQLEIQGAKHPYRVALYAQRTFDVRALQDASMWTQRELELAVKELRSDLASQGGGGVIVTAFDDGARRSFTVVRVNAKSYQAPEQCIVLAPGRPPAALKADGKPCDFPSGSHVLVPVNDDAEQRLHHFVSYLRWLSPDMEALVLNAIRRPSLDHRLDRVETRLFAQTADEALAIPPTGAIARLKHWLAIALPLPVVRVAAAVLVVLLIGANGFVLHSVNSRLTDVVPSGEMYGKPAFPRSLGAAIVPAPEAEPFVDELRDLVNEIRANEDPLLRKLDETSFASIPTDATDEEIAQATGTNARAGGVLSGLIQLQLLALDQASRNQNFVKQWDVVATNAAFKKIPPAQLDGKPQGRLLAALACRLAPTTPALAFRNDCEKVTAEDIENGLPALIKFVKGRR